MDRMERSDHIAYDKHSVQILSALEKKYTRDYLTFFENLANSYKGGPKKKELDGLVVRIKKVVVLIQEIMRGDILSQEKADQLLGSVQYIEEKKQYWILQSHKIKALQEKLQQVTESTGIEETDLNASLDVAQAGVKQTRKARTPQTMVQKTLSKTYGLAKQAAVPTAAAILGPMYKPVRMMLDPLMGLSDTMSSTKESHITERVSPVAPQMRHPGLDQLFQSGQQQVPSLRNPQVESWKLFFDKEAYKAKWTKELLDNVKKIATNQGRSAGGGLLDNIGEGIKGALFTALGLSVGASGLVMAGLTVTTLAVGTLVAKKFVEDVMETTKSISDLKAAEQEKHRLHARLIDSYDRRIAREEDPEKIMRLEIQRTKEEGALWGPEADLMRNQRLRDVPRPEPEPTIISPDKLDEIISGAKKEMAAKTADRIQSVSAPTIPGLDIPMQELIQAMRELSEKMPGSKTQDATVLGPRSIHDPGDTLLQQYAGGNLTMGDN